MKAFIEHVQRDPQIALDLLYAVQDTIRAIPNPLNPERVRLQAAVDLAELGHVPRRPLPIRLELEAALVGVDLDGESLEQAS